MPARWQFRAQMETGEPFNIFTKYTPGDTVLRERFVGEGGTEGREDGGGVSPVIGVIGIRDGQGICARRPWCTLDCTCNLAAGPQHPVPVPAPALQHSMLRTASIPIVWFPPADGAPLLAAACATTPFVH